MPHNLEVRKQAFKEIEKERARQECLHPQNDFTNGHMLAVLTEEVGEVAKAIQEGSNLKEELIHVAAVCLRWLENKG